MAPSQENTVPLLKFTSDNEFEIQPTGYSPIEETRHPSFSSSFTSLPTSDGQMSCLFDFIRKSSTIYLFCVFTGVLEPFHLPYPTRPFLLRYYSCLLQLIFLSGTIGLFVIYCTSVHDKLFPLDSLAITTYFLGMVMQNVLILAASKAFHSSLGIQRLNINYRLYRKSFRETLPFVLIIIGGFLVITAVFCGILFDPRAGLRNMDIVFAILGVLSVVVPPTLISVGLMTFILLEQKITMGQIKHLLTNIKEGKVICVEDYFVMRDDNARRNVQTFWCLSLMILSTVWNTICGLIIAFTESKMLLQSGLLYALFTIFYTIIMFGRQALIFAVILGQIGEVNQLSAKIPEELVRQQWNKDSPNDYHLEVQRLSLLAACKECPLGSTIFGMRMTNFQIHAQVFLFALAFIVSFLRSIFIASLEE